MDAHLKDFKYIELTEKTIKALYKVYNTLGCTDYLMLKSEE